MPAYYIKGDMVRSQVNSANWPGVDNVINPAVITQVIC